MARKNIAASAEKQGENDVKATENAVKFICDFPSCKFVLKKLGEDGNPTFHTDANGNGKSVDVEEFNFTQVMSKNKDGKVDTSKSFCFFIADPDKHGKNFKRIVDILTKKCLNPMDKMYLEEDHFKKRNPEAFNIAKEKAELEDKLTAAEARAKELEAKLGFQKRN